MQEKDTSHNKDEVATVTEHTVSAPVKYAVNDTVVNTTTAPVVSQN